MSHSGSCRATGKIAFTSRREAKARRRKIPGGTKLNIYRCPACDYLHLGHMPQAVRNGQLTKPDWKARAR